MDETSNFDWSPVCRRIASIEASHDYPCDMHRKARQKVQAILAVGYSLSMEPQVDVHKMPVVESVYHAISKNIEIPKQFQIVTTIFCLEYSCEFQKELKEQASVLRTTNGPCAARRRSSSREAFLCVSFFRENFQLQGGVLCEHTYKFGGRRFRCHYLELDHIYQTLQVLFTVFFYILRKTAWKPMKRLATSGSSLSMRRFICSFLGSVSEGENLVQRVHICLNPRASFPVHKQRKRGV